MLAPGDSDRSIFMPASSWLEEMDVVNTELLASREEEADEGRETTMYFCIGRDPVSPGPPLDSSFTKGCKVDEALGTVLVTVDADWEVLRVMTYRERKKKKKINLSFVVSSSDDIMERETISHLESCKLFHIFQFPKQRPLL